MGLGNVTLSFETISAVAGIAGTIFGWLLNTLWQMKKEIKQDKQVEKEITTQEKIVEAIEKENNNPGMCQLHEYKLLEMKLNQDKLEKLIADSIKEMRKDFNDRLNIFEKRFNAFLDKIAVLED